MFFEVISVLVENWLSLWQAVFNGDWRGMATFVCRRQLRSVLFINRFVYKALFSLTFNMQKCSSGSAILAGAVSDMGNSGGCLGQQLAGGRSAAHLSCGWPNHTKSP